MKNYRDVCSATEAGFVTFQGLPGTIKTGCQPTPDEKSRYCSKHKPHICMKPKDHTEDDSKVDQVEDVAEMILAERITYFLQGIWVCIYHMMGTLGELPKQMCWSKSLANISPHFPELYCI